ncbi:MAG: hypothetical protein M1818_005783 [Claussenomyces sp. TS43310]|nr:MAG: hypothetical protein M1818_005783 [Claussenomyces sp. TS43310]
MAAPLQIHRRSHPQEPTSFALNEATPPEKQFQLPLTPPTTDERFSHGSDRSAVDSALQIFRRHQDHTLINPPTPVLLKPTQYERVLRKLEQDPVLLNHVDNNVRFDYDPISMLLSVRMPTPVHDFFTAFVTEKISKQLDVIKQRGDSSTEFAARIANGGCARIFLKENPDRDSQGARVRREPDAQFQHQDAEYPGVVLEISYSQDGKDLEKLAWDYIQYSNGDIKVVIGIDIKYGNTKEATLSVWRPRYVHEDGEEIDILEAEETIISQQFRAADGTFVNSTNILCLSLDDFATDEISTKFDFGNSREVNILYKELAQSLNKAEDMQKSREPTQGSRGQSVKSQRVTRKRKRSSTPFDQLRSEDEAEHLNHEAKVEERINAADRDFSSGTLFEDGDQRPRRSTRPKRGEP